MKEIMKNLLNVENAIMEVLIFTTPTNEAEAQLMRDLASARSRVEAMFNRLLELQIQKATVDLTAASHRLETHIEEMEAVEKTIEGVKQAIDIAAKVISVATEVATVLVTVP